MEIKVEPGTLSPITFEIKFLKILELGTWTYLGSAAVVVLRCFILYPPKYNCASKPLSPSLSFKITLSKTLVINPQRTE